MRRVRYSVAASLDAYIATPDGGFDWIVMDPEIDFEAMYDAVGALLMGRASWDVTVKMGGTGGPALPTYVYSRTLPEGEREGVTFVRDAVPHVRALRETDGKTLWLWGGGLGTGLPLLPSQGPRLSLRLRTQRTFQSSGIILLTYDVAG